MPIKTRFEALTLDRPELRLYALVDGLQYDAVFGERMEERAGVNRALFRGTQDEPLAHAGPWLFDVAQASEDMANIKALEQAAPAVSWLITALDLESLALVLQLHLDARLPDGRTALLRFYDPRVLVKLAEILTEAQRKEFFRLIEEWHFFHEGTHRWIGRAKNGRTH